MDHFRARTAILPGAALLWALGTSAAAAQDLVIRQDGSRASGRLTACAGERCMLGGKPVPRSEIAWIGLGVDPQAPPPGGTGGPRVHLADGTVRPGAMVGLSLGSVALADGSLERHLVRWICLACGGASAEATATRDLLIGRGGALRWGELQGCAGVACTLDNQPTPLAAVAWIGLAVDPENVAVPPVPADPNADTVVFRDGSARPAPLVGVDATTVATQRGSFPRPQVAWIYVAPRPGPPGPGAPGAPPRREEPPAATHGLRSAARAPGRPPPIDAASDDSRPTTTHGDASTIRPSRTGLPAMTTTRTTTRTSAGGVARGDHLHSPCAPVPRTNRSAAGFAPSASRDREPAWAWVPPVAPRSRPSSSSAWK